MAVVRRLSRAALFILVGAWFACAEPSAPNPAPRPRVDLRGALAAQERHSDKLLHVPGVVGTAVTILPDGRAGMQVLLERPGIVDVPVELDGVPVTAQVTGMIMALSNPTTRQRPAPAGYSVGHPSITAGTIGARVRDPLGRVYILSNNHVLANSNDATLGDPSYQPGPFDGGGPADQIATLADFESITFSTTAQNTMDAAIALSTTALLDNATPSDDGYGLPSAVIFGDADHDGFLDDRTALLGLNVQKYGRTTGLTHGQITGVNATVMICYEVSGISCTKFARYVDQVIITGTGFSNGGDSGSLIVTDDLDANPVALLFAGSATQTIGNRIDLVLDRFGVTIDGADAPPPGPFTDVAVTSIAAPAVVVLGDATSVTVTLRNRGNQDVTSSFDVSLFDASAGVSIGTQSVAGLAVTGSATVTFPWTPQAGGSHTLIAGHTLSDDRNTNNQDSTAVVVNPPLTDVAVASISAPGSVSVGKSVTVSVTVRNAGNQAVDSSFVVTLRDATADVTLGSETVAGLAVGAAATRTFTWNTTGAELGSHTLTATHDLADGQSGNDHLSVVVTVNPKTTDVAVASITGPPSVHQGDTAHFGVTVQNRGELDVTAGFDVILTNATAGVAIDTLTVPGLALGAADTLDFAWPTANVATTGHTLIAQQMLPDGNAGNNALAIGILVKPPVTFVNDLALTGVNAPGSVIEGQTATITVTVQNVGQQVIQDTAHIVLTDSTTGATIGTQQVAELSVGAIATLTFTWNATAIPLGPHTLVATHDLADANTANNRRSAVVVVTAPPVDVALTSFTGPASVIQGDTARFAVTVRNTGATDVTSSFNVRLTNGTSGATIGLHPVVALAAGDSAALEFLWPTAGVPVTGYILIAQQMLPDVDPSNNARAIAFVVKAPPAPPPATVDVAVTALTAPASVMQGSAATIVATLHNVGEQDVQTFDVTLTHGTSGVVIGTQTVAGLTAGASTTVSFVWSTQGMAAGNHALVAAHTFADASPANNQRSVTVAVTAPVVDIALTSLTGPTAVTVGDTAQYVVLVQNVGGTEVSGSFNVVLADGSAGVTIGTLPVDGLGAGATATLTFPWATAGVATTGHTLIARQMRQDSNGSNDSRAIAVVVSAPSVHVGNLTSSAVGGVWEPWTATVTVAVHDAAHRPVNGVMVQGSWGGPTGQCVTGEGGIDGECAIVYAGIAAATRLLSFSVSSLSCSGYTYRAVANHDPDGGSNGTTVFVRRPW